MSPGAITGRAIVYGVETLIGGSAGFREVIDPGALQGVDLSDVRMLRDHDASRILARVSSGTLKLTNARAGLDYEAELPDTGDGRDIFELVSRGDVTGNSFGFTVAKDEWFQEADRSTPLRVVTRLGKIFEISAVSFPAYPSTWVSAGGGPRKRSALSAAAELHRVTSSPWFTHTRTGQHPMNRVGVHPIPRPANVARLLRREESADMEIRETADDARWAAEQATEERLRKLPATASHVEVMRVLDPAGPWGAYISLAESRGVTAAYVAEMANVGRLNEVIEMPDISGPAD